MLSADNEETGPAAAYGKSKYFMEEECQKSKTDNFVILRPTSVWGRYHGRWEREFVRAVKFRYIFKIRYINPLRYFCFVENLAWFVAGLVERGIPNELKRQSKFISDPAIKLHTFIDSFALEVFGYQPVQLPKLFFYCGAKVGDILSYLGVRFPLTSFRLHNLSRDSILDDDEIVMLEPDIRFDIHQSCRRYKSQRDMM